MYIVFKTHVYDVWLFCTSHTGGYENEREAPTVGPSPIINIKKEKRETEEETKEILAKLERDTVSPWLS